MRKLIHCNICFPGGTDRAIWDCDTHARTRTCRCCRTTLPMRAQNKAVTAKHAMFEQMLAELTA
jgi:hypothetical protein